MYPLLYPLMIIFILFARKPTGLSIKFFDLFVVKTPMYMLKLILHNVRPFWNMHPAFGPPIKVVL